MRDDVPSAAIEETPADRTPSVGETLRSAREGYGVSIEQVCATLRIERNTVIAIEEDRFDAVGPPVFVKGYLKNYADCLGLYPEPLLQRYREQHGPAEPELRGRRPLGQQPERPIGVWLAGGAALALIGAFYLLRLPQQGDEPGAQSSANEPAAVEAVPGTAEARPTAAEGRAVASAAEYPGEAPARIETVIDDAAAAPVSGNEPGVTPISAADSAATPVPGNDPAGAPPDPDDPPPQPAPADRQAQPLSDGPGLVEIEVRFSAESWAEVTGAGGERLFYGLGRSGDEARFIAEAPVTVLFGNAEGVELEVDGEPFAYPPDSRSGNLARFTLTERTE